MSEILFHYVKVFPTTWAYLSSLLMIGLFFKFNRFWSVRNADLMLLILLAPGLLLAHFGQIKVGDAQKKAKLDAATPPSSTGAVGAATLPAPGSKIDPELKQGRDIRWLGFLWLFVVGILLLLRLLIDPTMVRRPLLEPNLSTGGLTFIGCSLFVFLMANVITSSNEAGDVATDARVEPALNEQDPQDPLADESRQSHGPGYLLLSMLPKFVTMPISDHEHAQTQGLNTTAKLMLILSHLLIVLGMVTIGYRHFGNLQMGIGAATMYLMLPYTALMTGRIDHAAPGALLIWAIACYRRPLMAGICLGLAGGMIYYPLFVLPLWVSFYWQRGLRRFILGLICALSVMVLGLAISHFAGVVIPGVAAGATFLEKLVTMFGIWSPRMSGLEGVWIDGTWDPIYRTPVIFAFIALAGTFAIWPAQKNLGTLLSCSSALMVAAQCWHGFGGGLFMAWYLPLLLMTFFRPNLEDRVALKVLSESWFPKKRIDAIAAALLLAVGSCYWLVNAGPRSLL
ncbi:MAG: hypothetical protein KDB14_09010 [Planctomycetales bacterium]|nr:hypothetical protein [Planctomycetales bacterium]